MNRSKGKASPNTSNQKNNNSSSRASARPSRPSRKQSKAKKPSAPRKPKSSTPTFGGPLTQQYIKTLSDPFEYSGIPMGFGSLVPSRVSTLYLRGSTAANSDGSLALAVFPCAAGTLGVANGGAAVSFATSATLVNSADQSAITSNYGSGRVVSLGIKAYPNLAATSTPGVCVAGAIPGSTYSLFTALTPNDLVSFPTSHVGKGYDGAVACGRPQDTVSFEFYQQVVNGAGFAGSTDYPCSIPYVAFTGIGNGTLVYYEVTVNIEAIEVLQHSSAPIGQNSNDNQKTLASEWENLEKMWSRVRTILPDPGCIGYNCLSGTGTLAKSVLTNGGNLGYGGQMRNRARNY